MALAAWQGRSHEAAELIDATISGTTARGDGLGLNLAQYTASLLYNGLGRYEDAMNWAELLCGHPGELAFANWGLAELIEAAVRSGQPSRAASALERLVATTQPSGTAWGRGIKRAAVPSSARAARPSGCTARRSASSPPLPREPNWPGPIFSTASGCAASAGAVKHGNSCGSR